MFDCSSYIVLSRMDTLDMDTVDKETRSRIMSRNRHRDTGPEIQLRSVLHRAGLRYRLYNKKLPGKPDLVFPRFRATVFVHGCYWHAHGCYRSSVPKSHQDYWKTKFSRNRERDVRNIALLRELNWRVMIIWECSVVGKNAMPSNELTETVCSWLHGSVKFVEVPGNQPRNVDKLY